MVFVKLAASVTLFALLYQLSDVIVYPLISWASNLLALLVISWWGGKFFTKKFVLPRLPPIDGKNRAILITGCDTGFGHLSALEFNRLGFHVFAGCLLSDGDGAKELKQKVSRKNAITILQLDVTNEEQIKEAFNVVDNFLKDSSNGVNELYGLLNNAGVMFCGQTEMYEAPKVDDIEKQMNINAYGTVRVSRMFAPLIRKSRGRIVNITSIVARLAIGGTMAYALSKAAAAKFTEMLQVELARFGVKVIGIEPWIVRTNLIVGKQLKQSVVDNWENKSSEEVKKAYGEAFYKRQLELMNFYSNFPYNSTTDMVVAAIKEAMTSYEPDSNYRVVHPALDWTIWIINEFVSWDLRLLLRGTFDFLLERFA